jgi:MFS family permease
MINIWGTTFIVGPFLGPALAGYLADALDWRGAFAILIGLYAVSTILVLVFGRETYYVPGIASKPQTFVQSLIGQGGAFEVHRPSFRASTISVVKYIFRWPMLLVGISMMVNFTWPIGITVTVDSFIRAPPYLMNNIEAASMRFAAVIGALIGWAIGYVFNEWVSKTRVHLSTWRPEFRLHGVWIPAIFEILGLTLFGLSLQFQLSWVAIAFGWCGVNIGLVGTMVAITAYILDKYPRHATTVSAILNMWRTCGMYTPSFSVFAVLIDGL